LVDLSLSTKKFKIQKNNIRIEETDVPPAFDQSIEDIGQIKNQESQNQTASINFSSREDFQTIIDQMVDGGYCYLDELVNNEHLSKLTCQLAELH
jgi:hypothetical protein